MPTPFRTAPIVQKSAPQRHEITDPRIQAKNYDDGFPYEQAWLGVRDPSLLADEMVAAGHQLADARPRRMSSC